MEVLEAAKKVDDKNSTDEDTKLKFHHVLLQTQTILLLTMKVCQRASDENKLAQKNST